MKNDLKQNKKDGLKESSLTYAIVPFEGREYKINVNNLKTVLYRLTNNNNIELNTQKEVLKALKKHKLMDDYFLENINRLEID